MKHHILTSVFVLLTVLASAQRKESVSIEKSFPASPIQRLEVSTSGGSIQVKGNNQELATVQLILRPNGRTNLLRNKNLKVIFEEEYELDLDRKGNTLVAHVKRKPGRSGNNPLSISYRIVVPTHISSRVATSGGSIEMENLTGEQIFSTSGGSLRLISLNGNVTGKTSGGSINARSSKGSIHLSTSGGSIHMEQLSGTIDVRTSGGSISATNVSGTLQASTSGGSIKLEQVNANIQAKTSGGSIVATLPQVTSPVKLITSGGHININLPKEQYELDLRGNQVKLDGIENFSGTLKKNMVRGRLGSGGPAITAATSAGSVNLNWL